MGQNQQNKFTAPRMLEVLVCPISKSVLRYNKDAQELVCERCKLAYPIRESVPILLPEEARGL